ncbi:hypothetical protein PHABIO_372 [Pseudomonas phage Phabio]|uniref:Uncharacterized protein n=1 Tax=Pseudomonas phage Phabio TaxID=2006668 RepID=A0A1Y0SZ05_9CAUD|nr:hypothetical protein MZD05_gp372 [Pseudomonas phage Phabio]ARV77003.1 hypothetical protein PHABIO_372 [Pseudomonas phage Phabio]
MKLEEQTLQDSCLNRLREIKEELVSELPEDLARTTGLLIQVAIGLTVETIEKHYQISFQSSELVESGTSEDPAIQMRSIPTTEYVHGLSAKYFESVNS